MSGYASRTSPAARPSAARSWPCGSLDEGWTLVKSRRKKRTSVLDSTASRSRTSSGKVNSSVFAGQTAWPGIKHRAGSNKPRTFVQKSGPGCTADGHGRPKRIKWPWKPWKVPASAMTLGDFLPSSSTRKAGEPSSYPRPDSNFQVYSDPLSSPVQNSNAVKPFMEAGIHHSHKLRWADRNPGLARLCHRLKHCHNPKQRKCTISGDRRSFAAAVMVGGVPARKEDRGEDDGGERNRPGFGRFRGRGAGRFRGRGRGRSEAHDGGRFGMDRQADCPDGRHNQGKDKKQGHGGNMVRYQDQRGRKAVDVDGKIISEVKKRVTELGDGAKNQKPIEPAAKKKKNACL